MIRTASVALVLVVLGLLALLWDVDGEEAAPSAEPAAVPAGAAPREPERPAERRRVERAPAPPETTAVEDAVPAEEPAAAPARAAPVPWLLARQEEDGSWAPAAGDRTTRTELTATVALYLLSLGPSAEHDAALARALVWLAGRIDEGDGRVIDPVAGYDRCAHATAALALVEAAAMNPNLRRRLEPEPAMAHLMSDLAGDAFRRVGADRTTEVEAATWAAMTLCSGALGGAGVRKEQLERARSNVRGFFGDSSDVAFDDRSVAMLACADVLLGARPDDDVRLRKGLDALLERTADGRLDDPRLAYFGTLAMYQVGGASWEAWRTRLAAAPRPLDAAPDSASVHAVATRAMADAIVERWDLVFGRSR